MERMKQLHPFVEILAKAKPKLRRALLQNLDKDIVKAFSELCLNITNSKHFDAIMSKETVQSTS